MSTSNPNTLNFEVKPSVLRYKVDGKTTIGRSATVQGKLIVGDDPDPGLAAELAVGGLEHSIRYCLASMDRTSRKLFLNTEEDAEKFYDLLKRTGVTMKTAYDTRGLLTTFAVTGCERPSELPAAKPAWPYEKQADGAFSFRFVVVSDAADSSALVSLQGKLPKTEFCDENEDSLRHTDRGNEWSEWIARTLSLTEHTGALAASVSEGSIFRGMTEASFAEYIEPLLKSTRGPDFFLRKRAADGRRNSREA